MERDQRITGSFRGQSSNHKAPTGFEVSNPWKVRITDPVSVGSQLRAETLTRDIDRESDLLVSKIATSFSFTFNVCAFLYFETIHIHLQLL